MYYGDEQANYTGARAAFGPWGGTMAAGAYAQMGGGYPGGAPGYYQGGPGEIGAFQNVGAMIRPATYTPPARAYVSPSGQYIQQAGMFRSLGNMIGWNDVPRNVAAMDYRLNSASDFSDRLGTGLAAAGLTAAGLAAGAAVAPLGAAAGGVLGAGAGGIAGSVFGPIGTRVGGMIGSGAGKLIGGLGVSMAPLMAASAVGEQLVQQMQIRSQLENASFRFVGAGSAMADPRTGAGMNIQARGAIAEHLTQMDVKDPMLNLEELTRILKGATGLGLMNNTQSVDEFKRKFKDVTDNVKNIARVFHTTLEEGLKVMRDFRAIGVTDPNMVGQMVMRSEATGLIAGKTGREMVEIGMQGAEMFRGTGVSMDIGFKAAQMNISAIRAARDANVLSQEAVAQAGGEEALAQRMTASGLGFAQSRTGRATMAAFYGGQGKMDFATMMDAARGNISLPDMVTRAAQNLSTPEELFRYQAKQEKLISKAGERFGGEGLQMSQMGTAMSMAKYVQQQIPGLDTETAFRGILKMHMGLSEPEIDTMVARVNNADKEYEARQKALATTKAKEQAENAYQNFFFTRAGSKIADVATGVMSVITNPLGRGIDTMKEGVRTWVEEQTMGLRRADISALRYRENAASELINRVTTPGMQGNAPTGVRTTGNLPYGAPLDLVRQEDLAYKSAAIEASKLPAGDIGRVFNLRRVNIDAGGLLARTSGEALLERMSSLTANTGLRVNTTRGGPQVVLSESLIGKGDTGVNYLQLRETESMLRPLVVNDSEAKNIRETSKTYKQTYTQVFQRAAGQDVSKFTNYKDLITSVTGKKDLKDVTTEEMAVVTDMFKNQKGDTIFSRDKAGDLLEQLQQDWRATHDALNSVDVEMMKSAQTKYENLKTSVAKKLGVSDEKVSSITNTSFQKLIDAQNAADPNEKKRLQMEAAQEISSTTGAQPKDVMEGLKKFSAAEVAPVLTGARWSASERETQSYQKDIEGLRSINEEVRVLQKFSGTRALKEAALVREESAKDDEERSIWKKMAASVEDPTKYLEFIKEHKKFLKEQELGGLVDTSETIEAIPELVQRLRESKGVGLTAQQMKFQETLSPEQKEKNQKAAQQNLEMAFAKLGQKVDPATMTKLVESNKSDMNNIITGLTDITKMQYASDVATGAGGGFKGSQAASTSSPQEAFATQVNINQAILNNLKQLQAMMIGK